LKPTFESAIAAFGVAAKDKLSNAGAYGEPEDQLRAPFERLLSDLAQLLDFPKAAVVAVGEASVGDLKTRPDYAITVHNALVGFIELKAPGKGADPRKFKDLHDKAQWDKLHSLPNLIIPMATLSAFGRTASWRPHLSRWSEMSNRPEATCRHLLVS